MRVREKESESQREPSKTYFLNSGHGEGGVPVFGSIKRTPPSSTSISSSLLLLLLLGGVGVAAVLKGKTAVAASKNEAKEEKKRRARTEEPVDLPSSPERLQSKPYYEETPILSYCAKEENTTQEEPIKSATPSKELIPTPRAEVKCDEKEKTKLDQNESEKGKEEKTRRERAKEEKTLKEKAKEKNDIPSLEEKALEGQAKLKEKTRIVPEIIVSPEVVKQVVPVPLKAESEKESIPTKQSRTPSVKTNRVEDLSINLTTVDELEEVDYITKIKTFKITRWPKTHTADLVQHGPESLLSVLLPMQLQVTVEQI